MNLKGVLIDLHCHLDGSLSIDTIKHLAKIQKISIPTDDELKEMVSVKRDCRDLNEYLEKFQFPLSLLQTKRAIYCGMYRLCKELKKQGLMYAEIRFAPQLHTQKGITQEEAVKVAIEGIIDSGFSAGLILCCMRGNNNRKENIQTVFLAKQYLGRGVVALDLAGAEAIYKTENFSELFQIAKNNKVPFTIHCGEADGKKSIKSALKWQPKRLGHGVRILECETLTKEVSKKDIFLELCPTSNINTKAFSSYEMFPLKTLMEKNLKVTINTDNLTVSDTSMQTEFMHMIETFKLEEKDVKTLLTNAVNASFVNKEKKREMLTKIQNHQF